MPNSILLIDDDVFILRTIGAFFEQRGWDVYRELTGEAGLETFARSLPDVVLLDLNLPGMDGLELLRRLKDDPRTRDIPVAIQVRDHIPHPAHELISVKIDSADPRPAKQDELGLLTWDLELPAGAKRVVQLVFTVEHPRGMSITGLPA